MLGSVCMLLVVQAHLLCSKLLVSFQDTNFLRGLGAVEKEKKILRSRSRDLGEEHKKALVIPQWVKTIKNHNHFLHNIECMPVFESFDSIVVSYTPLYRTG